MRYPHGRILVFARAPEPGYSKTRLIDRLGARGAAALQSEFIRRTVGTAVRCRLAPVHLWTSAQRETDFFDQFHSALDGEIHDQRGDDLGARMAHALDRTLQCADFAILIGTDCPVMDCGYLAGACAELNAGTDAVLGPAEDGGYVLVGLRRCDRRLFENVAWGTPEVLAQTRQRLDRLGWTRRELAPRWDVDNAHDLDRLLELDASFRRSIPDVGPAL